MSIRAKILFILVSALFLSFVVSALAYFHVGELDERMGLILDSKLPMAKAGREVRIEVHAIENAEARMIAADDASHLRSIEEHLTRLEGHIARGRALAEVSRNTTRWDEMNQQLAVLRADQRRLAELINTEVRDVQGLQRRIQPRVSALGRRLAAFKPAPPTSEPIDGVVETNIIRERRVAEVESQVRVFTSNLRDTTLFRYSSSQMDVFSQPLIQKAMARNGEELQDSAEVLLVAMKGLTVETTQSALERDIVEIIEESRDLEDRVFDVNARLVTLREDTRVNQERLSKLAMIAEKDQWRRIETARVSIAQRRTTAGYLILFFLVTGVLFVAGIAYLVMRSVTNSIGRLLRASRRLREGDLDVRVQIQGRDELQELGSSFNTMARYLQDRRQRQNDYNEIVTTLNTTIGVEPTLAAAITDLVGRTGSDLGAIYMYDPQGDCLKLAQSHALPRSVLTRDDIMLNQGVVGQVASSRRLAFVHPVPEGMFDLDVGVGEAATKCLLVLPLVHLDALLGVLVLGATRVYAMEDVTFIEEAVFQLSVAVSNARFYETIQSSAVKIQENNEKLIEQQTDLELANTQLAEANRLKTEFLANVTHELRTPLNSIIGYTDLVLETADLKERQGKNLKTVLRNANNLLGLINDLLDISKAESNEVTLTLETFDLGELIDEVIDLAQPLVGGKSLELVGSVSGQSVRMFSDRMKCKQIFVNLVSNAIKFTDEGMVSLSAEPSDSHVVIEVSDSGIGMRPEDKDVIFDKFRQLDGSSSRKYGGTGLGLAITKKLCKFLEGDVSVESAVGRGSVFTVTLPTSLAPQGMMMLGDRGAAGGQGRNGPGSEGSRPGLLVVDDDPRTVVDLREGLQGMGIEVVSAFTALDAADILSQPVKPVGVVIGAALPEEEASRSMMDVWNLIKDHELPVMLLWDGVGQVPTYGYVEETKTEGSELTEAKMARVIGFLGRPVSVESVLDHLKDVGAIKG